MRKISAILLLFMFVSAKMFALSWHSVNIDAETAAAMTAAYGLEAAQEQMTTSSLEKIVSHYRSASVATAGIVLSKKKDRDAMRNPGLFASEENYYYKRILNLVKNRIMPKFITVASKMIKYPENALYWGPYLLKTTENVEQLCKQFELVCTNGTLTFKDVQFLLINDDLKKIFDLTKLGGNANLQEVLDNLGEFTHKDLSTDNIGGDMETLANLLAQIGKNDQDFNLMEITKIAGAFHSSASDILNIYNDFKEKYEAFKDGANIKSLLMQVVKTADADGVARLFKIDDYNVEGYISNYVKELQDQYYTQRWYIMQEDAGSKILYHDEIPDYQKLNGGNPDWWYKTYWNDYTKLGKEYIAKGNSWLSMDDESHYELTSSDIKELKEMALQRSSWDQQRINQYQKENPGHTIKVDYALSHQTSIEWKSGKRKNHCIYAYGITVTDTWSIKDQVYEEIFDSQTMDITTFKNRMEARLKGYQDKVADIEGNNIAYKLCSDPPRYYQQADEKKMEGCNSVTFTATCDGGASLAEGSFNWKENGKQGKSLEWPKSKDFAMDGTPDSENDGINELLSLQKEYKSQISSLQSQISKNDTEMKNLISQINAAKLANNRTLQQQLQGKYDTLSNQNANLKQELTATQKKLNECDNAIQEYYNDLSENFDGPYRIPKNMIDLEGMYQIQWSDEGDWVQGSDEYTFTRHGYCPTVKSNVTYTAVLKLSQKPKYFLGIRIHRAILSVDFKLTSEYQSDNIVARLNLDMNKSEQERAEEVNQKLQELKEEMPDCSIAIKYNYAGTQQQEDDSDTIHLLWASDRLDVARDIELQLVNIYSQLILLDKVMQYRESILDFLKHQIWDVVTRASRGTIAEYALSRWEDAGLKALENQSINSSNKEETNNNTSNNTTKN